MLVPFNYIEENIVSPQLEIDDKQDVMEKFRITGKDLINLCGGIPSDHTNRLVLSASSLYKDTLHVRIITNLYEVSRTLHFDSRAIINQGMIVHTPRKGIGTNLFLNQVRAAKAKQFRRLAIVAQAPTEEEPHWAGYYCWGRMGYTMRGDDLELFKKWAAQRERKESTLYHLLKFKKGQLLWKLEGFEWLGEFWLDDNSKNLLYLKAYLKEKKLIYNW